MNFAYRLPAHEIVGSQNVHGLRWGEVLVWALAALVVLSASAAGAVLALSWRSVPDLPGAPPPAIMIELAEIAVAPRVEDVAADEGELSLPQEVRPAFEPSQGEAAPEEVVEPIAPEILPEPVNEPAEPVQPAPVEPADARTPVERVEEVVTETADEVVSDVVEAISEVVVPMPVALPASITEQRRRFAEQQERERRRREQQAQQQQAASAPTAPRSIEAEPSQRMAAPQETETTRAIPNISPQQWQSRIIAHLNRARRYPDGARNRREEGVPHLQFTIDKAGQVLSARIVRSSGFLALDEAALEMVHRASPLPAPPAGIGGPAVTLTVPVNFNLR